MWRDRTSACGRSIHRADCSTPGCPHSWNFCGDHFPKEHRRNSPLTSQGEAGSCRIRSDIRYGRKSAFLRQSSGSTITQLHICRSGCGLGRSLPTAIDETESEQLPHVTVSYPKNDEVPKRTGPKGKWDGRSKIYVGSYMQLGRCFENGSGCARADEKSHTATEAAAFSATRSI